MFESIRKHICTATAKTWETGSVLTLELNRRKRGPIGVATPLVEADAGKETESGVATGNTVSYGDTCQKHLRRAFGKGGDEPGGAGLLDCSGSLT